MKEWWYDHPPTTSCTECKCVFLQQWSLMTLLHFHDFFVVSQIKRSSWMWWRMSSASSDDSGVSFEDVLEKYISWVIQKCMFSQLKYASISLSAKVPFRIALLFWKVHQTQKLQLMFLTLYLHIRVIVMTTSRLQPFVYNSLITTSTK